MNGTTAPDGVQLPSGAQALLAQSRRAETPCGDGVMVWRCWGQGTPVVLLHGGSGSWTHWVRNIPTLVACGRQVWVPDLPGFGDSDLPPGGCDADAVVGPLALGLRQLLGSEPHEVVAFSFGSLVAVLLGAQHPGLIARLLLVGLPILPLHHGRGMALPSLRGATTPEERAATHRAGLAAIMIYKASCIDDDTVAMQSINAARDRMRARKLVTTDACSLALIALQCEFECIWGAEDVLYRTVWAKVYAACETSPRCARLTLLPDAGHWVQYEQAQVFNPLLIAWARHT